MLKRSGKLRSRRRAKTTAGRPNLPRHLYTAMVKVLRGFAGGKCENPWCRIKTHLDPHHVVKRSHGGSDHPDNITMLCRPCHDRTDLARHHHRWLGVEAQGSGVFVFGQNLDWGPRQPKFEILQMGPPVAYSRYVRDDYAGPAGARIDSDTYSR